VTKVDSHLKQNPLSIYFEILDMFGHDLVDIAVSLGLLINIYIALPAEEGDHLGDHPVPQPLVAGDQGYQGHGIPCICKYQDKAL